jgi:hypothetical protein
LLYVVAMRGQGENVERHFVIYQLVLSSRAERGICSSQENADPSLRSG